MTSAILIRTGSFLGSPASLAGDADSGAAAIRRSRSTVFSPRSPAPSSALHVETGDRRDGGGLRRVRSEADIISSAPALHSPPPPRVAEDEEEEGLDLRLGFWDGSVGKGGIGGGGDRRGGGGGDWYEKRKIGEQYRQMVRCDPMNPLILVNYGKYLHEVEGDVKGAEEYYGRAILASPRDSEALSLYGKLVWETERDEERAGDYFERAVEAAPNDCYVLGSYAHFLWDSEEGDQEGRVSAPSSLVEAF